MTIVDEAILKAIALLQQQPEPKGPHVGAAISILEDTQTTPTASGRDIALASLAIQEEKIALALQLDKVVELAAREVERANAAEARVAELEAAIITAQETPNA